MQEHMMEVKSAAARLAVTIIAAAGMHFVVDMGGEHLCCRVHVFTQ
jgi:hypothetical protein